MFISAIDQRQQMAKTGFVYLFVTLVTALTGAVYEIFSYGIYSYSMIYAFAYPLAGGVLPFFWLAFFCRRLPGRVSLNLYHSGLATMTVGSLFTGVLEIYGTTNRLVFVYWIAGVVLVGSGTFLFLTNLRKRTSPSPTRTEEPNHDF